ncbi:MAG: hypothetical protein HC888_19540 [Candidatus Competibacteraceae bacterium]|nr:hypothetical protein [Candidatus Competibacteraceae bacterium]
MLAGTLTTPGAGQRQRDGAVEIGDVAAGNRDVVSVTAGRRDRDGLAGQLGHGEIRAVDRNVAHRFGERHPPSDAVGVGGGLAGV